MGQLDCLPYEQNVLDLDPVAVDRYGVPVVRVTFKLGGSRLGFAFLRDKLETWLLEAGAARHGRPTSIGSIPGTPMADRMGGDPETSVVDGFGFAHESPNLGVIGASVFPTAGGHNPTLTLQAITWRTAEHLVANWATIGSHS